MNGLPVTSQLNNLNALISFLPQYQGFIGQLNSILPQLAGILSSAELQSLKDKVIQVVLSQVGNKPTLDALKDKIRPFLQQLLGSKPQSRIDFDALLQQIASVATSALPGILFGLLGKRDLATDDSRSLAEVLALVDKYQLSTILPQVELFLGPDKLQELQTQFFSTVVTALGNNWNIATVAQALQQLVTQFVPQMGAMRIDWEALGQSALNGLVSAIPSIAIGLFSMFGKRDLSAAYQQLLSQLPVNQFAQIIQVVLNSDKSVVLAKIRELLKSFFAAQQGRINFDDLATNLLSHLNNLLPTLSQSIFSIFLG